MVNWFYSAPRNWCRSSSYLDDAWRFSRGAIESICFGPNTTGPSSVSGPFFLYIRHP